MKVNELLESRKTMSIDAVFALEGCDSGNGKHRKKNEYIRYKLKEEWVEFKEDVKKNGVKKPIKLKKVDGKLCIIDGYHRISALKELKNSKEIKTENVIITIEDISASKKIDMDF